MEDNRQEQVRPVQLTGPQMSADNGLSGLGLIMQLGGTIYLGLMAFLLMTTLIATGGAGESWIIILVAGGGAARSGVHRAAGSAILYGPERSEFNPGGPLKMTWTYIVISVIHTVLVLGVVDSKLPLHGAQLVTFGTMLLAWPATLAIMLSMPRFKQFADSIPKPSDRGFEGASILMLLLGIIGSFFSGWILFMMVQLPGPILSSFQGMLLLGTLVALLIRSIQHARAGAAGTSGTEPDRVYDAVNKYVSWGVGSSLFVGGAMLFLLMSTQMNAAALFMLSIGLYLLLAWPLIVKRYFQERNFSLFFSEEQSEAAPYRRTPDMGMTSLGWLLLATAVMSLSSALPGALFGPKAVLGEMAAGMGMLTSGDLASQFGRPQWWTVLMGLIQLWAAWELITMSKRWKQATFIYGSATALITLYVIMPLLENLDMFTQHLGSGFGNLMVFGQVGMALAIPIGAMILANRTPKDVDAPTAQIPQS